MAVPYQTTGGYGSPVVNLDGSTNTNSLDPTPSVTPIILNATGVLGPATFTSNLQSSTDTAILVELRVISSLLVMQLIVNNGTGMVIDLNTMRADEYYTQTPASGVL